MKNLYTLLVMLAAVSAPAFGQNRHSDRDSTKVFTKVTDPPQFPGGKEGWRAYQRRNLNMPAEAAEKDAAGDVQVSFLI